MGASWREEFAISRSKFFKSSPHFWKPSRFQVLRLQIPAIIGVSVHHIFFLTRTLLFQCLNVEPDIVKAFRGGIAPEVACDFIKACNSKGKFVCLYLCLCLSAYLYLGSTRFRELELVYLHKLYCCCVGVCRSRVCKFKSQFIINFHGQCHPSTGSRRAGVSYWQKIQSTLHISNSKWP